MRPNIAKGRFGSLLFAVVYASMLLLALLLPAITSAESQGISQGYESSDDLLRPGMAVQLAMSGDQDKKVVERASSQFPERIIGISSSPENNLVVTGSTKNQVYIQTSGQVVAYVSDLGGVVKKGDILTISPLKGILMKVTDEKAAQIATALEDVDPSKAEEVGINGGPTDTKKAKVYKILVNLDRHTFTSNQNNSSTLSRISRALVGKDVGELRVLLAMLLFALLLIVEGGVVYGAIASSMTSLGRNPMAAPAIKRELRRVLLIAMGILLTGLAVVYAILWV